MTHTAQLRLNGEQFPQHRLGFQLRLDHDEPVQKPLIWHGIAFETREQLCEEPRIIQMMKERIHTLQQQLALYEQVKRFTLLPNPLSMEKGELTNTLKIRRRVLNENYKEQIEKMYLD